MKKVLLGLFVFMIFLVFNCGGPMYRDCIDECYDRAEDCDCDGNDADCHENCTKEINECMDWCASGCASPPEKDWE